MRTEFRDVLAFLNVLSISNGWDLCVFTRNLFAELLVCLISPDEDTIRILVPEVFSFLFHQSNLEKYYENLSLSKTLPKCLEETFPTEIKLDQIVKFFSEYSDEKMKGYRFIGRVSERSEWPDIELGWRLIEFLTRSQIRLIYAIPFMNMNLKSNEIISFI
jgi:hypothetical protein